MEPLVHPSELSVWHCFLQARRINRETSRSRNPDWYKKPTGLDAQLHLFVEGDAIIRASHRAVAGGKVTWADVEAPPMNGEEEEIGEYFANYFEAHLKKKHRSLGVVLHVADEFAISELNQFSEAPEDYDELRERLLTDPQEVVEDHTVSVDELSFRLLPYRGQQDVPFAGVAITISRRHHELLRQFRNCGEQANFAVVTGALSAPLEALAALPELLDEKPEKPFCVFFSYQDFSVVAFFNDQCELALLRSIRHHSGGIPGNAHVIVQTMAVSLELADPQVYLLNLSQQPISANNSLEGAVVLDWTSVEGISGETPFEFQTPGLIAAVDPEAENPRPLTTTLTFADFVENKWLEQDFLPTLEEEQLYPSEAEMKILSWGKIAVRAGAGLMVLFLLFVGARVFQIMRDPAWHNPASNQVNAGNTMLQTQINRYDQWDAFLEDRSKAWVNMELLSRIFPDPTAVVVLELNHVAKPEAVRDMAKISLVKDWTITGYANDAAIDHLTILNTPEGIRKAFQEAYLATGDASLQPDLPSRNLVVNLEAVENRRYDPDKGAGPAFQFPFQFTLRIAQRISSDDPLSIPAAAAP